MKKLFNVLLTISVVIIIASQSFAIPVEINYQGYLTDAGGAPVDGTTNITFRLYNVESGGSSLWDSGAVPVDVANGVYSVILGDTSAGSTQPTIDPVIFANQLWLGVEVEADGEMTPRQKLTASGYSISAVTAESVAPAGQGPGSSLDADTVDGMQASDIIAAATSATIAAENIQLSSTAVNDLSSTNLQEALDQEISVKLQNELVGYWSIENIEPVSTGFRKKCDQAVPDYNAPGTVVFANNGSYSVCTGRFAATGIESSDTQYSATTYNVKDKGTLIINIYDSINVVETIWPILVSNVKKDSITMIASGTGCGEAVGLRYSKLTRISHAETCP